FQCSLPHPTLHSFPTRRSSDLVCRRRLIYAALLVALAILPNVLHVYGALMYRPAGMYLPTPDRESHVVQVKFLDRTLFHLDAPRSEEHTSELQSLAYLVCRLLL